MKARILRISKECIGWLISPGKHCYESADNPLPEDAKVERVFIDPGRSHEIALVLTSESFGEVGEGKIIPEIDPKPMFRRLEI